MIRAEPMFCRLLVVNRVRSEHGLLPGPRQLLQLRQPHPRDDHLVLVPLRHDNTVRLRRGLYAVMSGAVDPLWT